MQGPWGFPWGSEPRPMGWSWESFTQPSLLLGAGHLRPREGLQVTQHDFKGPRPRQRPCPSFPLPRGQHPDSGTCAMHVVHTPACPRLADSA